MKLNPLDNFRNFLSSRPPLVVFLVCVGMMAIAFISYGYYIKYNDKIYNPDVLHDYNTLLHNITKLDLCADVKNWFAIKSVSSNISQILLDGKTKPKEYRKHSFRLTVSVMTTPNISQKITSFVSVMKAEMLGVRGPHENSTVVMEFQPETDDTTLSCDDESSCIYNLKTCVSVTARSEVFPNTPVPSTCSPRDVFHNNSNALILSLEALKPKQSILNTAVTKCKSQIYLKPMHSYDRTLTVLLTMEQRRDANSHLMYSSYLLFVIIVTILLFGILVGSKDRRHRHTNHYSTMHSSRADTHKNTKLLQV